MTHYYMLSVLFGMCRPMLQLADGKGPFTSTGIEALLYMKANNSLNADPGLPDLELLQSFATIGFDIGTRRHILLNYICAKNEPHSITEQC